MPHLYKCLECDEYTLNSQLCPRCGKEVVSPHPPKYSPFDKYGKYRRLAKKRARGNI